jgi:glycine cleavage system H protein
MMGGIRPAVAGRLDRMNRQRAGRMIPQPQSGGANVMKDLSELKFPDDLHYVESHEWVRAEGGRVRIGITDYAQDQLGDIVYVELPAVGKTFAKGAPFGSVESVKAVSELYMPIGGKVAEINADLENSPEVVNTGPYGQGWMIVVEPASADEVNGLLTRDAYLDKLKG